MRIEPVEKDRAPAPVRRIYEAIEREGRPVTNLLKMLARKPPVLRAYNQLSGALFAEDSKLSPKLKELAYLRVSILNGCTY
jgi:alkylhydroperoxidase family enzyme